MKDFGVMFILVVAGAAGSIAGSIAIACVCFVAAAYVGIATPFTPYVSTEWHDYRPLFPKRINGKLVKDGLQRRKWGSGSCSETAIDWIEYRVKPDALIQP